MNEECPIDTVTMTHAAIATASELAAKKRGVTYEKQKLFHAKWVELIGT